MEVSINKTILNSTADCFVFLPPSFSKNELILFIILNTITGIIAFIGNGIVIYTIFTNKHLLTRTIGFLLQLCCSDFLIALVAQPVATYNVVRKSIYKDVNMCVASITLFYTAIAMCGTSCCFLALISFDRYQHISKQMNYNNHVSKKKVVCLSIACWCIPLSTGLLLFCSHTAHAADIVAAVIIIANITIVCVCYLKSWYLVKNHFLNRTQTLRSYTQPQQEEKALNEYWKISKSMLLLVCCFVVTWLPVVSFAVIDELSYTVQRGKIAQPEITAKLFYFALWFGCLNACLNPFLYYWKTRELRNAIKSSVNAMLFCRKNRNSYQIIH